MQQLTARLQKTKIFMKAKLKIGREGSILPLREFGFGSLLFEYALSLDLTERVGQKRNFMKLLTDRNSMLISSESGGKFRVWARTFRASSSRPWLTSQRGEKGLVELSIRQLKFILNKTHSRMAPNPRIKAGTIWSASGKRHAASLWVAPVPPI